MRLVATTLLALALALAGCATGPVPADQIVAFDKEGEPIDASQRRWTGRYERLERDAYDAHLDTVFESLGAYALARERAGRPKQVALYIHGGLNQPGQAMARARERAAQMAEDGVFGLFVVWDSSLGSCYRDHVFFVRQGNDWGWWGVPLAPFYFLGDLLRGVARAPVVWASGLSSFFRSVPRTVTPEEKEIRRRLETRAREVGQAAPNLRLGAQFEEVRIGGDYRTRLQIALQNALWLVTLPTKAVIGPLVEGVGASAWAMMERRIDLMFVPKQSYGEALSAEPAGLPRFVRRLRDFVEEHPDLELMLVGHSMGAIVTNNILTMTDSPRIDHVVYLAPAASVLDTYQSLGQYLRRHPAVRFHLVTLHPSAETSELQVAGLAPRGSLLVWVDDFLNVPLTPIDRTMGQFENFVITRQLAPLIIPEELENGTVRVFSVGWEAPEPEPTTHSGAARVPFWRESLWLSSGAEEEANDDP